MPNWFQLGGFPMWLTLIFGALTIVAAGRYAGEPRRRHLPLTGGLGALTLLSGVFGFALGLAKSTISLSNVPPDRRWIWLVGFGESLVNVAFAFGLVTVATLAVVIGLWRLDRAV